jgi:DNA-binding NarL/FixJ family response regulator
MVTLIKKNSSESTTRFKIINEIPKANSTICIINDSDILRKKIYSSFKNEYHIDQIVKTSKKNYIENYTANKFDVIITDIEFTEGIDTLFIKELNLNSPHTRIVIYTNPKNRSKRIQSMEFGAEFFIFMDDELKLLEFVVRKIIGKSFELD